MDKTSKPKPIFIVGAARTGTTNLCNLLSEIPSIAGVTSVYHYGTCESKILRNKLFWGDLSKCRNFLDFISKVKYSDYFISANGQVEHIFNLKPKDYNEFYFELMDVFAASKGSRFWITKLDDLFFVYPKHFNEFLYEVEKRYGKGGFEVIWIKRNLEDSLRSYILMEGKSAKQRKRSIYQKPAIFLQTLRYMNVYKMAEKYFPNIHKIEFNDYKRDSMEVLSRISFLKGELNGNLNQKKFEINTSFKNREKFELNVIDRLTVALAKLMVKLNSGATIILIRFFESKRRTGNPLYYRIFMHKYFQDELIDDLEGREAYDLMKTLKLNVLK